MAGTNSLPPQLCARLREDAHLKLLRANTEFQNFFIKQWHHRTLLDDALKLVVEPPQLASMTRLQQTRSIYLYSVEMQHEDVTDMNLVLKIWSVQQIMSGSEVALPTSWDLGLKYLQFLFDVDCVWSLPRELFRECLQRFETSTCGDYPDPANALLDLHSVDSGVFDFTDVGNMIYFRVVRSRPANRFSVPIPHVVSSSSVVDAAVLGLVRVRGRGVILHRSREEHVKLDLSAVVARMGECCLRLYRWHEVEYRSAQAPRVQADVLALSDRYDLPVDVSMARSTVAGGSSQSQSTALVPVGIDQGSFHLQYIHARRTLPARAGSSSVAFAELDGVHMERATALQDLQIARNAADDFWFIKCEFAGCELGMVGYLARGPSLASNPVLRRRASSLENPKLALIAKLHLLGWRPSSAALCSLEA